jgi:predicted MFS family arabinose efflux permease
MSIPDSTATSRSLATFGVVLLGQFVSRMGAALTTFALGAHVYQASGSVARFALFLMFGMLPAVLLSPFTGVLADRWDRRKLMLVGDLGSGFSILLIWGLFTGQEAGLWMLQDWHYYPPLFLSATFSTLSFPSWAATVPLLVPRQHLGRASGLAELSSTASQIVGPLVASALLGHIGLRGILLLHSVSYGFSMCALLWVRFPSPPATGKRAGPRSLGADLAEAWNFLRERPGLRGLLGFIMSICFTAAMVMLLINPLVLAFTDIHSLKWIVSAAGTGGLLGGILTSVWGGPRRRILGLVCISIPAGLVLLLAALPPNVPLIAGAAAFFLFTFPIINASAQFIWQVKVPPALQGRVAALRRVLVQGTGLVTTLMGGLLADRVFEPWLAPDGALASTVGRVIGTGQGRGVAFMFLLLCGLHLASVARVWMSPRVRNVETELPDQLPSSAAAPPTPALATAQAAPPPPALANAGGTRS